MSQPSTHKFRGILCGIIAAVCYGTNPLGVLPLYAEGLNACSVLSYRFVFATIMLGLLMVAQCKSLAVTRRELAILAPLGVLMSSSSITLYLSFHYMDAGIASTLLFVYPVMVAVLMAVFFKERVTKATSLAIMLALFGIGLLYQGDGNATLSLTGVALVMVSSLTYAVYIIMVNKSPLRMSSLKLTFYVLLFGTMTIMAFSLLGTEGHLQWPPSLLAWGLGLMLALLPTVISLVTMAVSVREVGSTPTAIMGALEPVTAVVIGVFVFGEVFTLRLAVGIVLILSAVLLIIAGKSINRHSLMLVRGYMGRLLQKTWRWK